MALRFAPLAPDPVLLDPAGTGDFAAELAQAAAQDQVPPWCSWIGWDGAVPVVMGGFKGDPAADGLVEIGYLTFASQQGRGFASELARYLVDLARSHGATRVIAHTLMANNASTRVLEKAGFVRDGIGHDDDVGQVWRWGCDTM